jgi:peptidoglycan/xylan/chitin deacetylase (PgdA/CDA1 family)
MAELGTVFLMYHELALPGRPLCHAEPGYSRYVVSVSDFHSQMEALARAGWHGKSVSQAIHSFTERSLGEKSVCITFDDGCETDLLAAAPVLKDFGFGATFYITAGFVGKPGYLSEEQVRNLRAQGFEIGCHSLTHPYLTDIEANRLHDEVAGAKDRVQRMAEVSVEHFSCPGGRWNESVARAVKSAGYQTMATSRIGVNFAHADRFTLARVAVLKGTSAEKLLRTCSGQGFLRKQLQEKASAAAKILLGNSLYDSLRGLVLGREHDSEANPL